MSTEPFGFVGLGAMGGPMIEKAIEVGLTVHVFDTNQAALDSAAKLGAKIEKSAAGVASAVEVVFVSLPNAPIVEAVALGSDEIIEGTRVKHYIDLSTTGPTVAIKVGRAFQDRGISALDCPVSGGIVGVKNKTLAIMASGPKETLDRANPLLRSFTKTFVHIGPELGKAQIVKLANNILMATNMLIVAEAMAFAEKGGVDPKDLFEVVNNGSGRSWVSEIAYPKHVLTRHLDLMYNPSHLEFVNPVVLGSVRARQDLVGDMARERVVPVLLHGDASLAGEGIVFETLVTSMLPPYETGGTVHVVVNNQVGFTTSPASARTSRYCTDIAKAIGAPVLHVNGDDPETCIHAIQVATEFRMRFKHDVFVDLVCYRRYGHNELDDPTFTQPMMYRAIAAHVPAAKAYAARLVADGVLGADGVEQIAQRLDGALQEAHRRTRSEPPVEKTEPLRGTWAGLEWAGADWSARTAVPREQLITIAERAAALPPDFHPHAKIQRLLAERADMMAQDRVDWGLGEVLAFGSLLLEGRHVRLSGQDTGRGTFSHRHAVLSDQANGRVWVPLQHLADDQGRFDVIDSPLNEAATMGFEYGYSTADPHTLVLWEAQFGDFANVAQVIIDQFMASAESKWRRMSGLVLLLPHGYEGQGPEHSSARLERFLQLCAHRNLQVCDLTHPAQLFHALRRQLARNFRKPLVIMSPKSLLRHKRAVSPLRDFTDGAFQPVLDDPGVQDARAVRRVLMMSGKVFFTVLEARDARALGDVALVRIEQLYPFPYDELREVLKRYPGARELRWVQEEPANMGAWRNLRHRLEGVLPDGTMLSLAARKAAPTSATGFWSTHLDQEKELLDRALCEVGALRPRRAAGERSRAAGRGR